MEVKISIATSNIMEFISQESLVRLTVFKNVSIENFHLQMLLKF